MENPKLKLLAMKKKLFGICLTFLYFKTCISLASSDKVLAEVGKTVTLPCNKETTGDIDWLKGKTLFIRYVKSQKLHGNTERERRPSYNVPSHKTNNLSIMDVTMGEAGTYTCQYEKSTIKTVELLVFQVSAFPSASLLMSEDLVLTLTSSPSPVPGLQVSWKKDGTVKSSDLKLEESNVQINNGGHYVCHIRMDGGNELTITTHITVFGFQDFPSIVYTSGKNPVTVPWIFNFNIRNLPMSSGVHVLNGSISHLSQILTKLIVVEGAASWPPESDVKDVLQPPSDLSLHLLNPKAGRYQMEIFLEINNRIKNLTREVCVANLTVSESKSDLDRDTRVQLYCHVGCIDSNKKLCWHQWKTSREVCGQQGQTSLSTDVTVGNETTVIWSCSLTSGKDRLVSANVTLEVKSVLDLSNPLFLVAVGVGTFTFLLIVVITTLVIAWKRRARRARYRSWLLENLHQQRTCACKGFTPQRLKENI